MRPLLSLPLPNALHTKMTTHRAHLISVNKKTSFYAHDFVRSHAIFPSLPCLAIQHQEQKEKWIKFRRNLPLRGKGDFTRTVGNQLAQVGEWGQVHF